jgi:predicted glycoside hydrolase/deacetylase ChbG (UPF0249 family)
MLIVNADDLGRTKVETDSALHCFAKGRITSATAMVYMDDSERAASQAKATSIDVGLHLNLTQPFDSRACDPALSRAHTRVIAKLSKSKLAGLVYHPSLQAELRLVVRAQVVEFIRLYGKAPSHIDGHRHMHLCADMLLGNVVDRGIKMRRHFHFWPGEKSVLNRTYRRIADRLLTRRHPSTDYFFALSQCINTDRMQKVIALADSAVVEIMTHPANAQERSYMLSDAWNETLARVATGTYSVLGRSCR